MDGHKVKTSRTALFSILILLKKVCGGAPALSEESSSSSYSKNLSDIEDDDEGRGRVRLPVGRQPMAVFENRGFFSRILF